MARPALLFDLDGTLLDTDAIHRAVFADMLAPHGIEVTEGYYMAHVHGRLNQDIFAEILPGVGDPDALSAAKEAEFRRRLPRPYPSLPGAEGIVRRAVEDGWGLAVVTNAMRANACAMLEAIGLAEAFDVLVIGEECARAKPHPDPYLEAMRLLGAAPENCVAFEDSPSGMRAAALSGAYAVGVRSALSDRALREHGAWETIDDFNDPALETILAHLTGDTVP
jgi:HAD superfamily hydrolase (TIGR01509 family)